MNGKCLVAYHAKKNKNPDMLLSSCHADNLVAINETKKNSNDPGPQQKKKKRGHV